MNQARALRRPLHVALVVVALATPLAAQQPLAPMPLSRINGEIELDGYVRELVWDAIEPLPLTMHTPVFGGDPTERTELRVAYDDEYLYVSGRMFDSDPAGIRATSLRRDDPSFSNDWMVLVLDTFNDKETTLIFATNPAGIRTDAVVTNDGGRIDVAWNTFWDAAARRTAEGWSAEIRIPLSSLRFQQHDGRVVMGLAAYRRIARKGELTIFPAIPRRWGANSIYKASQLREVVLENVHRRDVVYATPYVLGGAGRDHALNGTQTGYIADDRSVREAGLDVKYGVTSNLTLDASYNTDFAQVEADDQQVNLTRFSLLFPERRLFFLERASAFEFRAGGTDRLFYSRRIGLAGSGRVPIRGGARLVGRVGSWDVGLMNMQTAAAGDVPAENFGVLRLRRQVWNENSYVGAILTTRLGGGHRNVVHGLDGIVRLFGQDYLTLTLAQSFDDEEAAGTAADRSLLHARWERRGIAGPGYTVEASHTGAGFDPGIGFVRRRGHVRMGSGVSYGWIPGRGSPVLRHTLEASGYAFRRSGDGRIESAGIGPRWVLETRSGHGFSVGATRLRDVLDGTFRLSDDAHVPPGAYDFTTLELAYRGSDQQVLRTRAGLDVGSFYDGWRVQAGIGPQWNVSKHLELLGSYELNRIELPDRGQRFTASVAQVRVRAMLNTRVYASARVQYNSAGDAAVANIRLRYNPREGDDLYVVYNAGLSTDRFAYDPARPLVREQVLMVKYARTFGIRMP